MRIAWIGGDVAEGGGVSGMGRMLIEGLLRRGVNVDYFSGAYDAPVALRQSPHFRHFSVQSWWKWGRWYSSFSILALFTGTFARRQAYGQLIALLLRRHRAQPYSLVLQFSQTELFELGQNLKQLPPVIVYPCVHAAGELRWHRAESKYARQFESLGVHYLARAFLAYRVGVQRRDTLKPAMVIGMSRRFNELVQRDYRIKRHRQGLLYHPIAPVDLSTPDPTTTGRPLQIVYISRISVRKGVEQVIELSHRLDDLAGKVEIKVIGDKTLWSDYTPHLKKLNPRTAEYLGGRPHQEVGQILRASAMLILPSQYEPGGIVVGEAVASGVPVVVSDEVGSGEPIDSGCCRRFRAGNIDEFEAAVRGLLADLGRSREAIRALCLAEASKHFGIDKVAADLESILHDVAARGTSAVVS